MSTKSKTRKRPNEPGKLIGIRMQDDLVAAVDEWRRKQDDLPNRPEAIRRLLRATLKQGGRHER